MSHARTGWQTDIESFLSNDRMTDWSHTANAATASVPGTLAVGMAQSIADTIIAQISKNIPIFLSGVRTAKYRATATTAETTELIAVTPRLMANDTSAAGFPRIRIL